MNIDPQLLGAFVKALETDIDPRVLAGVARSLQDPSISSEELGHIAEAVQGMRLAPQGSLPAKLQAALERGDKMDEAWFIRNPHAIAMERKPSKAEQEVRAFGGESALVRIEIYRGPVGFVKVQFEDGEAHSGPPKELTTSSNSSASSKRPKPRGFGK